MLHQLQRQLQLCRRRFLTHHRHRLCSGQGTFLLSLLLLLLPLLLLLRLLLLLFYHLLSTRRHFRPIRSLASALLDALLPRPLLALFEIVRLRASAPPCVEPGLVSRAARPPLRSASCSLPTSCLATTTLPSSPTSTSSLTTAPSSLTSMLPRRRASSPSTRSSSRFTAQSSPLVARLLGET